MRCRVSTRTPLRGTAGPRTAAETAAPAPGIAESAAAVGTGTGGGVVGVPGEDRATLVLADEVCVLNVRDACQVWVPSPQQPYGAVLLIAQK